MVEEQLEKIRKAEEFISYLPPEDAEICKELREAEFFRAASRIEELSQLYRHSMWIAMRNE